MQIYKIKVKSAQVIQFLNVTEVGSLFQWDFFPAYCIKLTLTELLTSTKVLSFLDRGMIEVMYNLDWSLSWDLMHENGFIWPEYR